MADRTQCHALPPQAPSASTFSSSLLCTLVPNGLCPSLPSSLGGWRVPVVPRHFPGLGTGSAFGHPNLDVRERTSESCLSWEGKGRGEEGKREAFPQLYEKWLLPKYLLQGPKCPQPPSPPEFQVAWLCTAPHRPPLCSPLILLQVENQLMPAGHRVREPSAPLAPQAPRSALQRRRAVPDPVWHQRQFLSEHGGEQAMPWCPMGTHMSSSLWGQRGPTPRNRGKGSRDQNCGCF